MEENQDGGNSWFEKLHYNLIKCFQPGGQTKFSQKTELSNKGLFALTYNNNINTNVSSKLKFPPIK